MLEYPEEQPTSLPQDILSTIERIVDPFRYLTQSDDLKRITSVLSNLEDNEKQVLINFIRHCDKLRANKINGIQKAWFNGDILAFINLYIYHHEHADSKLRFPLFELMQETIKEQTASWNLIEITQKLTAAEKNNEWHQTISSIFEGIVFLLGFMLATAVTALMWPCSVAVVTLAITLAALLVLTFATWLIHDYVYIDESHVDLARINQGMHGFFSTSDIIPQVPSECSEESIKSSP